MPKISTGSVALAHPLPSQFPKAKMAKAHQCIFICYVLNHFVLWHRFYLKTPTHTTHNARRGSVPQISRTQQCLTFIVYCSPTKPELELVLVRVISPISQVCVYLLWLCQPHLLIITTTQNSGLTNRTFNSLFFIFRKPKYVSCNSFHLKFFSSISEYTKSYYFFNLLNFGPCHILLERDRRYC